jgi:hypothetical protein
VKKIERVSTRVAACGVRLSDRPVAATVARRISRATFDDAARLIRADASFRAGSAVHLAAEAVVLANALHENVLNNGHDQFGRWRAAWIAARDAVEYVRAARRRS